MVTELMICENYISRFEDLIPYYEEIADFTSDNIIKVKKNE